MSETAARSTELVELARLATARGDRGAAIAAYRRVVEHDADGGDEALDVEVLVALGTLEAEAGELDEAAAHLRRALDALTRLLGADAPRLADPMVRLAAVRAAVDDLATAEELLRRAAAIVDPQGPVLPAVLNDLARVLVRRGDNAAAETVLVTLHEVKVGRVGAVHPEAATVLATLAAVRQALGKHESAEQLWREVVDIRERSLAPGHFATSIAIEGLAGACATRGRFGEAVDLLRRAVAMREQTLGPGHASLGQLHARIADLELQAAYADDASGVDAPGVGGTSMTLVRLPSIPVARNGGSPARTARAAAAERATSAHGPVVGAIRAPRALLGDDEAPEEERAAAPQVLLVHGDDDQYDDMPAATGIRPVLARHRVTILAGALVVLAAVGAIFVARQRASASDEWALTEPTAPHLSLAGAPGAGAPAPIAGAAGGAIAAAADSSERARPRPEPRAETRPRPERESPAVPTPPSPPTLSAPAAPTVDLGRVTAAIGRGVDPAAAGVSSGVTESARAQLTSAAPLRPTVGASNVGFRAVAIDPRSPQPIYPSALAGTERRGTATLEFVVDSAGRATGVARVTSADHPLFAQAVVDALPAMRFLAASKEGRPVSQRVVMTFTFVPLDE